MKSKLQLCGVNNTANEVVAANLKATIERGYVLLEVQADQHRPVSIVGAGPSLAHTYKKLVGDVIACNSAHDFLLSKGVIPKYAMVWDAHPVMKGILTPHKDVKYLIASRCHPSLFEVLKGFDVSVWHALGDEFLESVLHGRRESLVTGGSSSVTRAMSLAGMMGYTTEMHLFGADSSYADGKTHVNGSLVDQTKISLECCGKWFDTAPWMALQANDFKVLAPMIKANGIRIVVHGTGLIPYVASIMKFETPDLKVSLYEKIRREVYGFARLYQELRSSPQLLGGSHAGI